MCGTNKDFQLFCSEKIKLKTIIYLFRLMLWWGIQTIQKLVYRDPKSEIIYVDYRNDSLPQSYWGMTSQYVPWMIQIENKEMRIYQLNPIKKN